MGAQTSMWPAWELLLGPFDFGGEDQFVVFFVSWGVMLGDIAVPGLSLWRGSMMAGEGL